MTHEESEPPEGLFGFLDTPDRPLYLTETPLDALSLNEHGFPAVAPAYGPPPSATTANELHGRRVYLLTADDESSEEWRLTWSDALRAHEADPLEVVLPTDVEGHVIQGANDFLRTHPLGFAFADAIRLLTATAEDRAAAGRNETDAASTTPAEVAPPGQEPPATPAAARKSVGEDNGPPISAAAEAPTPREVPATSAAPRQKTGPPDEEQSPYLRSFLQAREEAHEEVAATGVPELNRRLAGGLDRGLYLLAGEPGTGKTAFLEDMAVEAATSGRPVVYYALREGPLSTWERLIARLSRIMGGRPIALHDLRGGALDEEGLSALAELDGTFRLAILPRLTLVDSVPGGPDAVSAFLDDLRHRVGDRVAAYRRVPLVLIDDLDYLLLTLGAPDPAPASRLTLSLNDFLLKSHAPGVLVSTLTSRALGAGGTTEQHHPEHMGEGLFVLSFHDRPSENGTTRLDLGILKNPRTGWLGRLVLRFDRESGLFWADE